MSFLQTAAIGALGGLLFTVLHLPIPWLLGPMLAVMVSARLLPFNLQWDKRMRNAGLIVIGYVIGRSLTPTALAEIFSQFWLMLVFTASLVALCIGIAYMITKLSGLDFKTALLGTIPGGMTQALVMAEETEGVDVAIVTMTQTVRLLIIICSVPIIVAVMPSEPLTVTEEVFHFTPSFVGYMLAATIAALLAAHFRFPTAYLIGPALITVILQLLLPSEPMPAAIIHVAQLAMGVSVGLMLKPSDGKQKGALLYALLSGSILFVAASLLALLFYQLTDASAATSLLALVPGGLDQLGMVAHAVGADLPLVSGYQIFRLFFVLLIVPFIMRAIFTHIDNSHTST